MCQFFIKSEDTQETIKSQLRNYCRLVQIMKNCIVIIKEQENQNRDHKVHDGNSILLGSVGVGAIAVLSPTALCMTATTFGAAGTGIAISQLTGAAATAAQLAW